MKIAQFTSSLLSPLGGAEQYCLALAKHQRATGHDVTVVTGWISDDVRDELEAAGLGVLVVTSERPYSPDRQGGSLGAKLNFHGREALDSVRRTDATRALEAEKFDVVHVHRFAGFGTSVLRVRGARLVHTVHDFSLVDTSASLATGDVAKVRAGFAQRARASLVRTGLPETTTLVFPSARTRSRHDDWGFPTASFDSRVVPHGWSAPAPSADEARAEFNADGDLRFLFLGKVATHKGIPLLLEAWGDGIPGARLAIAGDGPLLGEVGQAPGVDWLGWLDESSRTTALHGADVLVFPSQWPENFPIVVAESMLAGVPVLTTTIASPPLVDDGASGLVVGADAASLRSAMERLVADRGLLYRLSQGASIRAEQLDMTTHGGILEGIYHDGATTLAGASA